MSEKGSPILLALVLGLLYWASIPVDAPDPTQCDLMDTTPLVEEVATVKESLTLESNHISDAAKDAAVSISLARSLAENHIADANKMVDPMPSPSDKHEKIKREILIFVSANCPPCDKWKRCEMNRFLDAGWAVGIVEVHSYGLTPTFEIESGEKKATLTGYATLEQAAEAVR
jgi:hypothetical protein